MCKVCVRVRVVLLKCVMATAQFYRRVSPACKVEILESDIIDLGNGLLSYMEAGSKRVLTLKSDRNFPSGNLQTVSNITWQQQTLLWICLK